ncbi:uncharacterized protein TRAVEDRAFT_50732 [Trametes versicolor FP-101664 SS1]|uniref:uncharacterized protein n=1 Tax=Trametes versicolor (strain FP-101664) TaxID=717944 RepID=UPI0004623BEE|nr:uncharacterized protein TRAVEDRAFT_50732 [Trametes versicolor FP-101664 SS1]EIW54596.1 hypothetical protein TRAVEDRAFT_50732 [Trametes versicolor FP-101664 SS1]
METSSGTPDGRVPRAPAGNTKPKKKVQTVPGDGNGSAPHAPSGSGTGDADLPEPEQQPAEYGESDGGAPQDPPLVPGAETDAGAPTRKGKITQGAARASQFAAKHYPPRDVILIPHRDDSEGSEDEDEDEDEIDSPPPKNAKGKGKARAKKTADTDAAPKAKAVAKPARGVTAGDVRVTLKGTEVAEASKTTLTKEDAAQAAEAFLGFGYGSLSDDQGFRWFFGQGNARAISPQRLAQLKQSFIEQGITPWRDPIAIVVDGRYIEPGCLTKEAITSDDGPTIQWTNAVDDQWVDILGGQHRQRALQEREKELKLDVDRMDQKIEKLHNARRNEQEKEASLARLRYIRDNVRSLVGDPLRWLFAVYDKGKVIKDNRRVILHLSENDNKKSYPQTAEETLQKHHFHVVDALAKRKNPEDILGSASYRDNVLEPIVGDKAMKRGNARLLVHPHSFTFLSNIFRLTYVRNGQTVKASALRQRLLFTQAKHIARIHKKRLDNTVGGMWADVFALLVDQMTFIASSSRFGLVHPMKSRSGMTEQEMFNDPELTKDMQTLRLYIRLRNDEHTPLETLNKAEDAMQITLASLLRDATSEEREIWHPTLMASIDALYVKYLRPHKEYFGSSTCPQWVEGMVKYWNVMVRTCDQWWSEDPHTPTTPTTVQAQRSALGKLQWWGAQRELADCLVLPWPTTSMLEDMYSVLQGASFAIQWLSRQLDPMVDKAIQAAPVNIWDHTSHMREYLADPLLMPHRSDPPWKLWEWIFHRLPELTRADVELEQFNGIHTTRFFSMSTNIHNSALSYADQLDDPAWDTFSAPWIDILGEDGWLPSYTREIDAIGHSLHLNVPKPLVVERLAKNMVLRYPRSKKHSLGVKVHDKYECVNLLDVHLVEWREVDSKARLRGMHGIAFYIFVAHKWYERTMSHMLSTDVGRCLREQFMEFLDEHWGMAPPHPVDQQGKRTEQPDSGPSQGTLHPPPVAGSSRQVPTIDVAVTSRVQWDKSIVDRLLANASLPVEIRDYQLEMRELAEKRQRLDAYTSGMKKLVKFLEKSPLVKYLPSEKGLMEGEVGAAVENLITKLVNNVNRSEFRRDFPNVPYVLPTTNLQMIDCPPVKVLHDPNYYTTLAELKARDPDVYSDYIARRALLHAALKKDKETDPAVVVPDIEELLPQDVYLAPPEMTLMPPADAESEAMDLDGRKQYLRNALLSDAFLPHMLKSEEHVNADDDSDYYSETADAAVVPHSTRITRSHAPPRDEDVDMEGAEQAVKDNNAPSHSVSQGGDQVDNDVVMVHDGHTSQAAPVEELPTDDVTTSFPSHGDIDSVERAQDDDSPMFDDNAGQLTSEVTTIQRHLQEIPIFDDKSSVLVDYHDGDVINRTPLVRLLIAAVSFSQWDDLDDINMELVRPGDDLFDDVWSELDDMADQDVIECLWDSVIEGLRPKECALAMLTYRPLEDSLDAVAALPPIRLPAECHTEYRELLRARCPDVLKPGMAQRNAAELLFEMLRQHLPPTPLQSPGDFHRPLSSVSPSVPSVPSPAVSSSARVDIQERLSSSDALIAAPPLDPTTHIASTHAHDAQPEGTPVDALEGPSSSIVPDSPSTSTPAASTSSRNKQMVQASKRMIDDEPEKPPPAKKPRRGRQRTRRARTSTVSVPTMSRTPASSHMSSSLSLDQGKAHATASMDAGDVDAIAEDEDAQAVKEVS